MTEEPGYGPESKTPRSRPRSAPGDLADAPKPAHSKGRWDEHIEFRTDGSGRPFAFIPNEVIVHLPDADSRRRFTSRRGDPALRSGLGQKDVVTITPRTVLIPDVPHPIRAAKMLTEMGFAAQPNHALFAAPGEVHANPAVAATGATFGNPALGAAGATFGNPFLGAAGATFGNPYLGANGATFGNPYVGAAGATFGNPYVGANGATFGNPAGAGCCPECGGDHPCAPLQAFTPRRGQAPRQNLCVPADEIKDLPTIPNLPACNVVVLDTGLSATAYRPDGFTGVHPFTQTPKKPDGPDTDEPDESNDSILDPVAGHGTFIAGIIRRLAPEANVRIVRVLSTFGVGDDARVAADINKLLKAKGKDKVHILSLSFSAYTEDDKPPMALADAIGDFLDGGGVVVASAGNDASCRICYPAALPDVVSVAALGPNGPAWFTNYGNWVRASAPGLDVVSRYYQHRNTTAKGMPAIERYAGWGSWSGTSFSAPIVAAVIARAVSRDGLAPPEAVRRYIDDPRLLRLPGLGTIINVH